MKLSTLNLVSSGLYTKEVKGVLVDTRKCIGCKACTIACKLWNDNPRETETFKTELTANTYSIISETEVEKDGTLEYALVRKQCMHCVEPWCVSVCPTGAIYKSKEGPVLYDSLRCIGCKYCIQACPYEVPNFDEEEHIIEKCDFCSDRLKLGLEPACVDTCITGALEFAPMDEIAAKAKEAISEGYSVYGLVEGGGTSFIYILQKNLEPKDVGLPEIGSASPSTHKLNLLKLTSWVGSVAAAFTLGGIAAAKYAERRKKVSESMKKDEKED